jgi:hypothetical protein
MSKAKAVIRAGHKTIYFSTWEAAEKFLENTKTWQVEEWTMEEEPELWNSIKENDVVEKPKRSGEIVS